MPVCCAGFILLLWHKQLLLLSYFLQQDACFHFVKGGKTFGWTDFEITSFLEGKKKREILTPTLLNFLEFKSLRSLNIKQNGDVISMCAGLRADPMSHGNQFGLNKSGTRSKSEHPLEQAGSFKDSVTSILGTFISLHVVGPFQHSLRLWAKGIGL